MKHIRPFRLVAALVALLLFAPSGAQAAPVSPEDALAVAKGYRAYTGGEILEGELGADIDEEPTVLKGEYRGEEIVLAFLFAYRPQGWILVSADDRTEPVVAFAAEGAPDLDANANARSFVTSLLLDEYAAMEAAEAAPTADADGGADPAPVAAEVAEASAQSAARRAKYAAAAPAFDCPLPTAAQELQSVSDPRVDKLLKTTWGQGDTYYVPVSGAPVGCVQTAEAQVLYYHRWPQSGIGKLTGYPSGEGVNPPLTTRGGDGEGGPYDWNAMGKSDNDGYMARSALMYDLGVINGVNWKSGGSGANLNISRLKSDLGYASAFECYGTSGYYSTNQTDVQRCNMTNALCCNLDAGFPCPNAGGGVGGSGSGHQTVVDGYGFQDGLLYFHVNMGWGGSWDAYFIAPRFDSYALYEIDYNVFPKTTGEIISGRVTDAGGKGMQGVTVTVTDSSGGVKTATTNARGIWYVIVPSATTHTVVASRNGYTSKTRTVTVGTSSYTPGNRWGVDFTLLPAGKAVVTGTVRNRDGIAFGGLTVVTGDGSASAVTDADGFYSIPVSGGWSGIVKLAGNQGLLGSDPASWSFSSVVAGTILSGRDFVVDSVLFVDCDATGNGNGTSWENAYTDLQAALLAAGAGTEIWVAEGTYKPTAGTDRTATFSLPDGVVIYGGFSGVETARDQRNWVQHMTRISGDIGVIGTATDNVKQLITAAGAGRVDGFVISDAYRENGSGSLVEGVNIQRKNYGSGVRDLVFEHCLVRDNACYYYMVEGGMSFRNCIFYNNRSLYLSSGKPYYEMARDCEFQLCTFVGNTFQSPTYSNGSIENCYLQGNSWTASTMSYSTVRNCIFDASLTVQNGTNVRSLDESWTAGPYTAPVLPPANSAAKNYGAAPSWASASTFDFLGNPRVVGSAVDCGAIEIQASPAAALAAAALDVGYTVATLQACVFSLGSGSSATLTVEYGTDPSLSGATALTASVAGPATKSFPLAGLAFGTTYYYRAKLSGGATASTGILTFRTKAMTAPTVALGAVGDPSTSAVAVGWSLSDLGTGAAKATVYVDYSTSETFEPCQSVTAKTDATGAASGTVTLSGLSAGATYHVRVRGVNDGGLVGTSDAAEFTTLDPAAPDFTFSVAPGAACTRGVVTLAVSSFGTGASSGVASADVSLWPDFREFQRFTANVSSTGSTTVELTRLSASTTYYVRVAIANDRGRSVSRSPQSFKTSAPGFVAPGLLQVRYGCASSSYPDFTVTAATASDFSTYDVERAPGPFMADYGTTGVNDFTGTSWTWANNTTFYYEGEMFFKGGTTYNFFHCVDDGVAIELDGEWLTRQTASNESGYNKGVLKASKTYASDGWHAIRIWVYDWTGGKGFVSGKIGFSGMGIGWNTNGCTTVNAANQANWSTLRDPGDASLLRVLSADSMPSFVELDDDLMIAGTTLTGTVRTDGVEDGCTVTLYAGHANAGSNTVGWAQTLDVGTVPSEDYDLSFQWDDFCSADDLTGWYVIARMTNPSGTYEGWSVVREPVAGNVFYVAIREGESALTSVKATPRVAGFGDGAKSATVCLEYSTDASFASAQSTANVTATSTNWLSEVTISGLSPNTLYYVRAKGVKGSQTVYSRAAQLSTLDYGTPVGTVSVGTTTLTTIPVSWSVTDLGLGNTAADVYLDYGTSTAYGSSVKIASVTSAQLPKSGTYTLSDLPGETTYHFRLRIVASPSGKTGTSADAAGQTKPVGNPVVSATLGAVAQYSAAFSYNLSSFGEGAVSATLYYDVSTSSSFPSGSTATTTIASGVASVPKTGTATATGLSAETTYYLRVRAVNHAGKTGTSATLTVNTTAVGNPVVSVAMADVLQRAATASISIATLGEAAKSATVTLEYGTTTSYGKTATVSGTPAAGAKLSALLEGLEPETTYYVRVTVKNDANKTGVATTSFETLPPNDPVLGVPSATTSYTSASVSVDVATLGSNAAYATGTVRYGTTSACSDGTVSIARFTRPGTVSASITGLSQDTTYYYEITIVNSFTGQATVAGSFRTKTVATLAWGEGYYEGGLLMGYKSGNGGSVSSPGTATLESGSWTTNTYARGPISSYIKYNESTVNEVDGATYSWGECKTYVYEGQMWFEAGVDYTFAGLFFPGEYLYVDGEEIFAATSCSEWAADYGLMKGTKGFSTSGWHDIRVVMWSTHSGNGGGGGACGGNANWCSAAGSPFYSRSIGLAWNTNGLTTVAENNVGLWKKLLDSGDRHLLRARGNQHEYAFLNQAPIWTKNSLTVPVGIETLVSGMTLTVYIGRRADAWYFEDRWERSATVASVPDGASVQSVTFSVIDTTTDWYVSARLSDGSKYDQWTDPVKWTPAIPDFEKPTFSVKATDGVEPMAFGGTSSAPKVTITINNPSDSAVYAVYASGTVDGTFARVTSKQTRKGDLLSFEVDAGTGGARFFQIKAAATESDLP